MELHRNAKLGLAGRFALVRRVEDGCRRVRRPRPPSASRRRRLTAGRTPLARRRARRSARSLACLFDRSSRPQRMPRLLPAREQRADLCCRRRTGWGPRLLDAPHRPSALDDLEGAEAPRALAPAAGRARARAPLRVALPRRSAAHGRQRSTPASTRPGHAVTGDRSRPRAEKRARVGYDYAHAIVDDHSRLAYAELPRRRTRRAPSPPSSNARSRLRRRTGSSAKPADDRQRLDATPRTARCASCSTAHRIRHLTHQAAPAAHQRQGRALPPDHGPRMGLRPRATAPQDTAPQRCHTGSTTTTTRRPHSSLGGLPPISRVHNVCGQDN